MGKSVMIFGLGHIGGWVLELLARSQGVDRIITALNHAVEYGQAKTDCAAIGASDLGYFKKFEFHKVDVNDVDRTAELLKSIHPDVIYSSMTLGSSRILWNLPSDVYRKLWDGARFGVLLPLQLSLLSKLMQAVNNSGISCHVVNSSFPDPANAVLWRNGFRVTVGVGGLNNVVGEIRKKVSDTEGVSMSEVTIQCIAAHAIVAHPGTDLPYFLKILVRNKDVTKKFDLHSLVSERWTSKLVTRDNAEAASLIFSGPRVASSSVKNIMAIINDTSEYTHSPGPNGLLGGYPVRLSAKGVEVILPEELTLEEATRICADGQKWGGIEEIRDDGTVVYTQKSHETMKEMVGYDCKELRFRDIDERAKELISLLKILMEKSGGRS